MLDLSSRLKHVLELYNPASIYVNPEKEWLWIRVHKTAGTSMFDLLQNNCYTTSKNNREVLNWLKRITASEINKYFIWSFVRNPYSRFVSAASMFKVPVHRFAKEFDQYRKKPMIFRHTEPQHELTHYHGLQIPDYIGRFENLHWDWIELMRILKMPMVKLKQLNGSNHKHWTKEIDQYTKDFVKDFYKKDFEYFFYEL